ncbi:MAG: hypothetical protein NZ866_01695 [Patescibacteria group bacterium]|nr:hypothetical protein [Patescibacteria group bacterium]
MEIYNKLIIRMKNKNFEIDFGIPNNENELIEMFKLRYEIYSKKNYIDIKRFPERLEKDDYDKNNKSIYFIAKINYDLIGSLRLIKDNLLPTQIYFDFIEPEEIKIIPPEKRIEIGRLVVKRKNLDSKVYLPRHLVMLTLFKSALSYCQENNYLGGYAFIKKTLEKKLKLIKFPFHYIKKYTQRYPKDGILFNYFNDIKDPVIPIYFLISEVKNYLDIFFNNRFIFSKSNSSLIFNDNIIKRFLLLSYLRFMNKKINLI